MIALALALIVFASSLLIDYAHARYAFARDEGRALVSSCWSAVQWGASAVGFVVAVKVSLWYMPLEVSGLFIGNFVAVRRRRRLAESAPSCNNEITR